MLSQVTELTLHSVIDRGIPNQERVALYAAQDIADTGVYAVLLGVSISDVDAVPIRDNFVWLGHGQIKAGDWVFIYTGHGQPGITQLPDGKSLINIYWQRNETVFYDPKLVACLVRFDAASVSSPPPAPQPLPQLPPNQPDLLATLSQAALTRTPYKA